MSTNWADIIKDSQVKRILILSTVVIALVFVGSFISAEFRASRGEHTKWLWGAIEYNIPNCDTLNNNNATNSTRIDKADNVNIGNSY